VTTDLDPRHPPATNRTPGPAALLIALGVVVVMAAALLAWRWMAQASGPVARPTVNLTPSPTATPSPTPEPVLIPLVPLTGAWSSETSISRAELAAALAGAGPSPRQVVITAADLAPLAAQLHIVPGPNVRTMDVAAVRAAIQAAPEALGILRAEEVGLGVRVLGVDGVSLFGEQHLGDLAKWPLLVAEPADAEPSSFDPGSVWTLAAGGDVMLDRTVYLRAVRDGLGPNYPWDGGFARITGRVCCGAPGLPLAVGEQTGQPGALRELLSGADITLVNLEGPAPDEHSYHADGYIFTMDPALLSGLRDAGIDAVSLANNHIINGGQVGVVDTVRNLDAVGIAHFGAGADLTTARQPAWLTVRGLRIAALGYNAIRPDLGATTTSAGAAPLDLAAARADIAAARAAGADLVVVMPHWGTEYTDLLTDKQRTAADGLVAAGADLVLGSHSHWAGPIGMVRDHLVIYSLGDFVFDLNHDEQTQEAVIAELTFSGRTLVQVSLHPTLILDRSQPNLLDPATDGQPLLQAIRAASAGMLPW
jgi:Putative enzyme of poly-gamma-glutamate biosynthesis (capsule formation)